MNKRYNKSEYYDQTPILIFLISVFLCGIILGCGCAVYIPHKGSTYLHKILNYYVINADFKDISLAKDLGFAILNNLKFPVILLLCAMTPLGFFLIPMAIAVKGFLISFSVCALIFELGFNGFVISFLSMGLNIIFMLPCILILSILLLDYCDLNLYMSLNRNLRHIKILFILIIFGVLVDTFVSPYLINIIFKKF